MARHTIAASGMRQGDTIISAGRTSHENKRLKVTRVERNPLGAVKVYGTSRGGDERMIFRALAGNLRVVVSR